MYFVHFEVLNPETINSVGAGTESRQSPISKSSVIEEDRLEVVCYERFVPTSAAPNTAVMAVMDGLLG